MSEEKDHSTRRWLMNTPSRVLGLVLGLFFSAGLTFGQNLGVIPIQSAQKEIRAFSVGVAIVKDPFSAAPSEPFVGRFSLPPGTVLETLKAHGLRTSLVRRITAKEPIPILMEGDEVRVFTDFESGTTTFDGVVVNPGGWGFQKADALCIQSKEGIVCLPKEEVIALSILSTNGGVPVPERLQEDRPLVVEVQGIPETTSPYLSYLVRGALSWEPLYALELTTGELEAFVSTENAIDFGKTRITFVMGEPFLVEGYLEGPTRGLGTAAMLAPTPPQAPQGVGEFWEYPFEGTVELEKGESLKLPLFQAKLALKELYSWDGGAVLRKHRFTNTLDRPLAAGRMECYEEGLWVGEDTIPWVAISQEGEVTSQYAKDIEVNERTTQQEEGRDKSTTEKEVSATNHKQEAVTIEIIRSLPDRANLVFADPTPKRDGSKLTWLLEMRPQETKKVRYRYEVLLEPKN
jgi:hypothetical protein